MIARGDIVTVTGQAGHWAVFEPAGGIPPGRRWCVLSPRPGRFGNEVPRGRIVGDGDMTVIASPAFEPGQMLKHWGEDVEVIADRGELVTIRQEKRRQVVSASLRYPRGIFITHTGDADVARGALVVENLNHLLKENNDD